MPHFHLHAILAATIAAVVLSTGYYMLFAKRMATLHPAYADASARPKPWMVGVEVLRSLVLVHVVALIAHFMSSDSAAEALHLALLLWVGFPVVLWIGAVVWERVPRALVLIHAGDWLLKLIVIALIVSLWR